jgi:hypothetical protein
MRRLGTADECLDEIERLQNELMAEKGWVSKYRDAYCEQVTEIARLKKDLARLMGKALLDWNLPDEGALTLHRLDLSAPVLDFIRQVNIKVDEILSAQLAALKTLPNDPDLQRFEDVMHTEVRWRHIPIIYIDYLADRTHTEIISTPVDKLMALRKKIDELTDVTDAGTSPTREGE